MEEMEDMEDMEDGDQDDQHKEIDEEDQEKIEQEDEASSQKMESIVTGRNTSLICNHRANGKFVKLLGYYILYLLVNVEAKLQFLRVHWHASFFSKCH